MQQILVCMAALVVGVSVAVGSTRRWKQRRRERSRTPPGRDVLWDRFWQGIIEEQRRRTHREN